MEETLDAQPGLVINTTTDEIEPFEIDDFERMQRFYERIKPGLVKVQESEHWRELWVGETLTIIFVALEMWQDNAAVIKAKLASMFGERICLPADNPT